MFKTTKRDIEEDHRKVIYKLSFDFIIDNFNTFRPETLNNFFKEMMR